MKENPQPTLFPIADKAVKVTFDGGQISSDGGLIVLREVEHQLGLIKALAAIIPDHRDQRYIDHLQITTENYPTLLIEK